MLVSGIGQDAENLSINGYYLRPSLAYKTDTIFGGDPELEKLLSNGYNVTFSDMLKSGLNEVNGLQFAADDLATQFAAGETDNIHQVLIAGQKADVALQLATAIRSKVMEAYQEIIRMQV